jgi:nucleoside-diphosphate-sugar epimerase
MADARVLVTGGSGFVAKHCIAELLHQDFEVRTTLRNPSRADEVRSSVGLAGQDASGVTFVAADLLNDDGWDAAMEGCTYVLHVASPFPLKEPRDPQDLIRPAREGALRVLNAARRTGVKRVVMTSSLIAMMLPWPEVPRGHVFTEVDWTNPERRGITTYAASKTLAESAAWSFAKSDPAAPELAVVNPGFVLGPALDPDISTSHGVLRLMAKGAYPAAPKVELAICDVRDVAITHALAMTHPRAAGERFISANGFLSLIEMARLLAEALPDLKSKVPRFELPDFVVRAVAIFDGNLKPLLPDLGFPRPASNAKARDVLGQSFHSPQEAVTSAAESLRALHVI